MMKMIQYHMENVQNSFDACEFHVLIHVSIVNKWHAIHHITSNFTIVHLL